MIDVECVICGDGLWCGFLFGVFFGGGICFVLSCLFVGVECLVGFSVGFYYYVVIFGIC